MTPAVTAMLCVTPFSRSPLDCLHRLLPGMPNEFSSSKRRMCKRRARFGSPNVPEVVELEPILKAYIYEAVEVENAGLKVNFKKTAEFLKNFYIS
jgi:hypothetical protein